MRLAPILVVALAALAAAAHAYSLKPDQCAFWISNVKDGWLPPGESPLWLNFTEAGTVQLIIRANMSFDAPVELAILDSQGQKIWAIGPSTRIAGADTVYLKAPGSYQLVVKNPVETRFATFFLNVTMCGGPAVEYWLRQYIGAPMNMTLNKTTISAATVGIVSYGVMEVDGRYFTYELTTDAVKGVAYIPSNISASGYSVHFIPPDVPTSDYWWRNGTYYYYGRAFSVQLGAIVVARLKDGAMQYYSIQNIVGFDEKYEGLRVWNYIWNATSLTLDRFAVSGKGEVYPWSLPYKYVMPGSIPFGRVELEMRTRADDGKIIIEFYANGQKYDEVTITPYAPAASAYIEIAPTTTSMGSPLALGLVFAGYDDHGYVLFTVLNAGRIGLELYVRMNGSWVPPPSAWSIARFGLSHARVVPQGVGSALVVPGEPNSRQLWAGTIIATPLGVNATNSTDLSPYIKSVIDLGNGTRHVLAGVYINGRPAQTLSNVPLGSLVALQYKRQYFVSISAPGNYTADWFDENSTIVINGPPVVDLGNGTRLVDPLVNGTRPPLVVEVDRPMSFVGTYTKQYLVTYSGPTWLNRTWIDAGASIAFNPPQIIDFGNNTRLVDPLINGARPPLVVIVNKPTGLSVEYTRQYLVSINTQFNNTSVWVNAGASYAPPASAISMNGVTFVPAHLTIDGRRAPLAPVAVNAPLNITVHYNAYAEVPTTFAGLPALYAEASIACGGASNSTSGLLASSLRLELIDAPAGTCSISARGVPSLALVAVAAVAAIVVLFRKRS